MYVFVLDNTGKVLEHRKLPTERHAFTDLLRPYRKDPVAAVKCLFCRHYLAGHCT